MHKFLFLLIVIFIFSDCKQQEQKNEYPAIDVIGYLKGQLKLLDTIPYGILKITEIKDKRADSSYIKKAELNRMLLPFFSEEISKSFLETNYEEKVFADAGSKKVNITYDARNKNATIHHIAVYMDPLTEQISLLYITGFFEESGRIIKKQLLWNHNKGFQIISVTDPTSSESNSFTERIIWQ
jgi:hypothetical protein